MLLTVVFSSLISPLAPMSTVLVRSPLATAFVTEAISRTCRKVEEHRETRGRGWRKIDSKGLVSGSEARKG